MSDDKTEEPTDSKLRKSREEGQVAKSQDLAIATSTLGVVIALQMLAESTLERLRLIFMSAFDFGDGDMPLVEAYQRMGDMTVQAILVVSVPMVVAALSAAAGLIVQVGLVIAVKAVEPKLENINPGSGIKKIVSVKSLITFLQMLLKALVLGIALWQVILALIPMISGAPYQSVHGVAVIAWAAVLKILTIATGLFCVLGPLDYAIQRMLFMKGQRMSKDEIKREYKSQEGDPQVKSERKQIAHEMAHSDPQRKVPRSDAVIVNPTHYAVALRYRSDEAGLPIVMAKGTGDEALLIRSIAEKNGVPVFSNPPLARALYKLPEGTAVPGELLAAVAAVLRWVGDLAQKPDTTMPPVPRARS